MPSKLRDLRFASHIVAKTRPYAEKRWHRSNKFCQAAPLQQSLGLAGCYGEKKRTAASGSLWTLGNSTRPPSRHSPHSTHRRSPRRSTWCVVKHRPGKSQTHVDGLSRLPVDPPPPEDAILQVRLLEDEDEARKIARELHTATHLGGRALWKLFRDRYSHKPGCRICLETTQSCPQCQLGTDYDHRQKMMGTIQFQGPWDMLFIDIVGPILPDHRHDS